MKTTAYLGIISSISIASIAALPVTTFAQTFSVNNGVNSPNSFNSTNGLFGQIFTPSRSTPNGNPAQALNPAAAAGAGSTVLLQQFSFLNASQPSNSANFQNLFIYKLNDISPTNASYINLGSNPANITAQGWTLLGVGTGGISGNNAVWNFPGGLTLDTQGTQYAAVAGSTFRGQTKSYSYTPFGITSLAPFNSINTGLSSGFLGIGGGNQPIINEARNLLFEALFSAPTDQSVPEGSTMIGLIAVGLFFVTSKLTKKD